MQRYNCKFSHIASSVGINKAITRDCLSYACFVLLFLSFALVDLGQLQHLKCWSSLWQKPIAGSYYNCYKELYVASEKHRQIKIKTTSSFSSVWISLIVFYSIMLWLIIIWVLKVVALTNIFNLNILNLQTGFVSTWQFILVYLPELLSNWGKLLPSKTLR